jgi:hypothetical protein
MLDAFSLLVPLAPPYRGLAPDLAARYAELAGGSPEVASALASAVNAAIDRVAAGAPPDAGVGLAFSPETSGDLRVELSCNGRRESLGVTISVAKR